MPPRPHHHRRGFTLLDLLLTLLVIGILALAGVPVLRSALANTRLTAAAAELAGALDYARVLAVRYQRPFGVRADADAGSFEVFDRRYELDPAAHPDSTPPVDAGGVVRDPATRNWFRRDFDALESCAGARFAGLPAGDQVLFRPEGHCGAADAVFELDLDGSRHRVTVSAATGRVLSDG